MSTKIPFILRAIALGSTYIHDSVFFELIMLRSGLCIFRSSLEFESGEKEPPFFTAVNARRSSLLATSDLFTSSGSLSVYAVSVVRLVRK